MARQGWREPNGVIEGMKHPALAEARRLVASSGNGFLVDGRRLVAQAIDSGADLRGAFFRHPVEDERLRELLDRARAAGVACHVLSRGIFFRLLGLGYETAAGVLAVAVRPPSADAVALAGGGGCLLVGERIQDPRNVGVMVRTADAWALPCAAFTADSADAWSRAALRSSTGSAFRVPIARLDDLPQALGRLRAAGLRIVGSSAHAERPCWEIDLTGPCAVVLGNETEGISPAAAAACDELVAILMCGGAHSFNVTVAAGILLYERARQLAR